MIYLTDLLMSDQMTVLNYQETLFEYPDHPWQKKLLVTSSPVEPTEG